MRSFLLIFFVTLAVSAQQIDGKGSIGYASFLDESPDNHLLVAGSTRFYITPKFSVEPEVQYLRRDSRHHDWVFVPNFNYDFKTGRVVPYVTIGLGVQRSFDSNFSHTEGFISGGGGVKLYFTDRWFVAPEFRLGLEPHARLSAAIGYSFRR